MIQFVYNKQQITIDQLFKEAYSLKSIDDFPAWALEKIEQNIISYNTYNRMDRAQFVKQRITVRKQQIQEQLVAAYMNSLQLKKKVKKKPIRNAYKKTEEFANAFEHAIQEDVTIRNLGNEKIVDYLYSDYLLSCKTKELKVIRSELESFCDTKRQEFLSQTINEEVFYQYEDELAKIIKETVETRLRTEECLSISRTYEYERHFSDFYRNNSYMYADDEDETAEIENFIDLFMDYTEMMVSELLYSGEFLDGYLIDFFFDKVPELAEIKAKDSWASIFFDLFDYELHDFSTDLVDDMDFTEIDILKNLMQNPHHLEQANAFYEKKRIQQDVSYLTQEEIENIRKKVEERRLMIGQSILSTIPEQYKDLYPLTRQIKRKFYLHIGPTNSGKTYHALEALRKIGSGIYLAPLRLLAYEQFEKLNSDGYPCNLLTGEERTRVPYAVFQSSTIEMADFTKHYRAAVIDEAQMLEDKGRGGAWTSAILGLCADEIHVCAAPYAKDILIRLIEECGDAYEVISYDRDIELSVEAEPFCFPKDVRKKDALIVFSKRKVHEIAEELHRSGWRCSIIYGSLPYDVRQEEARKFLNGDTNVLVTTDAIGMGMNLPIRRIVFLETGKFDGIESRPLKPAEIQQIAGRAGRKGMYEIGLVNCSENKRLISTGISACIPPIETAVQKFSESLLGINAPLSEIMDRWDKLAPNSGYKKESITAQIVLCRILEQYTDDKYLIYKFITIPFDSGNHRLRGIWLALFKDELNHVPYNYGAFLPVEYSEVYSEYLNVLEEDYKVCDLLWIYMERFHRTAEYQDLVERKRQISGQIMNVLAKKRLRW